MSHVRYATICDQCKTKSAEYCGFLVCAECSDDVCPACAETYDPDPPGYAVCKRCASDMRLEAHETAEAAYMRAHPLASKVTPC